MRITRAAWLPLVLLACVAVVGCAQRRVVVRSDPPGAECFFDGKPVGTTPAEFDFLWYGGHRVALRKEGYRPVEEVVRLSAPFYMYVPLDLAAELSPVPVRDRHELDFTLEPIEDDDGAGTKSD